MIALKLLAPLLAVGALAPAHTLYQSPQLWATVDVCNAPDRPNMLGIRGSMPGDGAAHDAMFMRFRIQYLNGTTHRWVDLPKGSGSAGADSGFLPVGSAASARESGRNFQLAPGASPFTLRGVVSFQWRRGGRVVHTTTRPTTTGHKSLAGADPAGFSAATCALG
jgi:hypothetical protein